MCVCVCVFGVGVTPPHAWNGGCRGRGGLLRCPGCHSAELKEGSVAERREGGGWIWGCGGAVCSLHASHLSMQFLFIHFILYISSFPCLLTVHCKDFFSSTASSEISIIANINIYLRVHTLQVTVGLNETTRVQGLWSYLVVFKWFLVAPCTLPTKKDWKRLSCCTDISWRPLNKEKRTRAETTSHVGPWELCVALVCMDT